MISHHPHLFEAVVEQRRRELTRLSGQYRLRRHVTRLRRQERV
jgi:hypothetical protein